MFKYLVCVGETIWEGLGYMAFLKKLYHRAWALKIQKANVFPSVLSSSCV